MKLSDAISVYAALSSIRAKAMPARTAFALARMTKTLFPEVETYEETRKTLIAKHHGTLAGDRYTFSDEAAKLFQAEITELLDEEITAAVKPIQLSMLENIDITPDEAASLLPVLEE
jgi:hypothetical protein